jgi:hypothetical protein
MTTMSALGYTVSVTDSAALVTSESFMVFVCAADTCSVKNANSEIDTNVFNMISSLLVKEGGGYR